MVSSIFSSNLFHNRVAIITGGGTGIGLRTAKEFIQLGGIVIIGSRKAEVIERAVKQLNSGSSSGSAAGGASFPAQQCYGHVLNIRDENSIAAFVKWIQESVLKPGQQVDYLVNSAGGQFPSLATDIPIKGWRAVIETNLTGTFLMSQAVHKHFFLPQSQRAAAGSNDRRNNGAIVNIVANMHNGFPGMSHTGAARAGVVNLTKSLAVEWASLGVRVNTIAPGVIASSGLGNYNADMQRMIKESAALNNYTTRLGTEAECASAILFLLSPASSFTSGVCLNIDGAESLYAPLFQPVQHTLNAAFDDEEKDRQLPEFLKAPSAAKSGSNQISHAIRSKL